MLRCYTSNTESKGMGGGDSYVYIGFKEKTGSDKV